MLPAWLSALGLQAKGAGNGEDAGPEEEEDDPAGSWFGSPAVDPLDACEKGETCQAEPWLGGLWGSKMVLLFVLLNFSDGLIDDETDVVAALFCCCCVAALSCMAVALGQTISHFCWCMDLLELSGVIDLPPCDDTVQSGDTVIQSETTVEETSRSTTAGGVASGSGGGGGDLYGVPSPNGNGSGDLPSLGTEAGFGAAVGSAGAAPTDLSKARAALEADIAALRLHEQGCAGKAKTLATELNVMKGEDGYKEHCKQLKIPFTGGRPDKDTAARKVELRRQMDWWNKNLDPFLSDGRTPRPLPSEKTQRELLVSAQNRVRTVPSNAPLGRPSLNQSVHTVPSSGDPSDPDDDDDDDDDDEDVDGDDAQMRAEVRKLQNLPPKTLEQWKEFCSSKQLQEKLFSGPDFILSGGSRLLEPELEDTVNQRVNIFVQAPHRFVNLRGRLKHTVPPCPYGCGFNAVVTGDIKDLGLHCSTIRRVAGLGGEQLALAGTRNACMKCKEKKMQLRADLVGRVRALLACSSDDCHLVDLEKLLGKRVCKLLTEDFRRAAIRIASASASLAAAVPAAAPTPTAGGTNVVAAVAVAAAAAAAATSALHAQHLRRTGLTSQVQLQLKLYRAAKYNFLSYAPGVMEAYASVDAYKFLCTDFPFICHRKLAVTKALALECLDAFCSVGSNPSDLARRLRTHVSWRRDNDALTDVSFRLMLKQMYLANEDGSLKEKSGDLYNYFPLLESTGAPPVTAASDRPASKPPDLQWNRTWPPGVKFLTHLFIQLSHLRSKHQTLFTQQFIGGVIGQIDHTMKIALRSATGGVSFAPYALHMMNEDGCICFCAFLQSTTYNDQACKMAFGFMKTVWSDGRGGFKLVYCDATSRDGPGIMASIPWDSGVTIGMPELPAFSGEWILIQSPTDRRLERHLQRLLRASQLYMDAEWMQGATGCDILQLCDGPSSSASPVLIIQLSSFPSGPLSTVCPLLHDVLYKTTIIGLSIRNDWTHLFSAKRVPDRWWEGAASNKKPNSLVGSRLLDLATLAHKDSQCPGNRTKSSKIQVGIEVLVRQQLNFRFDKAGSPQISNWQDQSLSPDQLAYAAQDVAILVDLWQSFQVASPVAAAGAAAVGDTAVQDALDEIREVNTQALQGISPLPLDPESALEGVSDLFNLDEKDDEDDDGEPLNVEQQQQQHFNAQEQQQHADASQPGPSIQTAIIELIGLYAQQNPLSPPLTLPDTMSVSERNDVHSYVERVGGKVDGTAEFRLDSSSSGQEPHRVLSIFFTPAAQSSADITDESLPDSIREQFIEKWQMVVLKLDPRHWMANFFSMAASKDSPLFPLFAMAVSSAVYTEDERKDPTTKLTRREEVTNHLLHTLKVLPNDLKRINWSYWRLKLRFFIAPPQKLYMALLRVYNLFKDIKCPKSGVSFFKLAHKKTFDQAMTYVKSGHLSDPPGIELYTLRKTLRAVQGQAGLKIYRCLRTSSPLEGFHAHLARCVCQMARGMGSMRLAMIVRAFEFRWNIHALQRAGKLSDKFQHDDVALRDDLHRISQSVYGVSVILGHRAVNMEAPVILPGPFDCANAVLRRECMEMMPNGGEAPPVATAADGSCRHFLARVGVPGVHTVPDARDIIAINAEAAERPAGGKAPPITRTGLLTVGCDGRDSESVAQKEGAAQAFHAAGGGLMMAAFRNSSLPCGLPSLSCAHPSTPLPPCRVTAPGAGALDAGTSVRINRSLNSVSSLSMLSGSPTLLVQPLLASAEAPLPNQKRKRGRGKSNGIDQLEDETDANYLKRRNCVSKQNQRAKERAAVEEALVAAAAALAAPALAAPTDDDNHMPVD